jgi:hypothetical protein
MEMVLGPDPVLTPQPLAADGDCAASTPGSYRQCCRRAVEQRLRAIAKYRQSKYSVNVSGLVERSEKAQEVIEIDRLGEHCRTRESFNDWDLRNERLSSRCPKRWQSGRSARHRNKILLTLRITCSVHTERVGGVRGTEQFTRLGTSVSQC